ncbi:MAG: amidohydrolase family protein [Actinomycetota bacterium]
MIIDFHQHLGSAEIWPSGPRELVESFPDNGYTDVAPGGDEFDLEAHHRLLDEAGIDVAVSIPSPNNDRSVMDVGLGLAAKSERIRAFVSVDPRSEYRPEDRFGALLAQGASGLKIHPVQNHILPNDPALYPLYAMASDCHLPVMFHTGSSVFPNAKHRFADPMLIDEVAADFPRLPIICAHAGRGFWEQQAFFLAKIRPNVFLELSGFPARRILTSFPELATIAEKIIFGTDWPSSPPLVRVVQQIQELPLPAEVKALLLGGNARRLLEQTAMPRLSR